MPRPSIDYLNARRAILPASGGAKQNHRVEYAPVDMTDGYNIAAKAIGDFSFWAEISRQQLVAKLAIPGSYRDEIQTMGECDEIPF